MKQTVTKIIILIAIGLGMQISSFAQCISPTLFTSTPAPAPCATTNFTSGAWGGEYVQLTGAAASASYTVTQTSGNTYYTITDGLNNVLSFGTSPVTFTTGAAGTYRIHVAANPAPTCGTNSTNTNFNITSNPPAPGPLSGTYTVPNACGFPDLATAILALNTYGVAGPVTINVTAPQSAPVGGYVLGSAILNPTTNATNTITINGGNNLITPQVGINTTADAAFILAGTDYVTLNQLNIVENPLNTTTTTQMERGIRLALFSADDAPKNCTIQNCTVNLNGTAASAVEAGILVNSDLYTSVGSLTTQVTPTSALGVPSDIVIKSNNILNCYNGIYVRGNTTLANYIPNLTVGGNAAIDGNIINGIAQGIAGTGYGIYVYYTNGDIIKYNQVTSSNTVATGTMYGIQPATNSGSRDLSNNDVTLSNLVAANTSSLYGIYNFGGATTVTMNNNNVHDCAHAGTGLTYQMYNSISSTGLQTMNNNTVTNFTRTGASGTFYGLFNSASGAGTREMMNNQVTNINYTAPTTGSTFYLMYPTGSQAMTMTGNTVNNVTYGGSAAGTSTIYGIYNLLSTNTHLIESNTISNITNSSPIAGGIIYGMYNSNASGTINIRRNNFFNLQNNGNVSGGGSRGMSILGAGIRNVENNFISDLIAPNAVGDNNIIGMEATGGTANITNNTINIGTGGIPLTGGTNFGATGFGWTTGVATVNLRNNIIRVNATPNGTGITAAMRGVFTGTTGVVPASINVATNNNILYAPNAARSYLYCEANPNQATAINPYDLTVDPGFNLSCGSLFKAFMGVRNSATFTENNLVSAAGNTWVPFGSSFAENSAISGLVAVDYTNTARGATPDRGALEFSGVANDASAPTISYTAITNSPYCTSLPNLSVTITDNSGVNSTLNKPRLYYKKSTEANALVGNTSLDNGWKYVEATNASSPFNFQLDAALLTSTPALGDMIQYFVVAEDLATIPNVGNNTATYAALYCPTSVALGAAGFPVAGSINSFTIVAPNGIATGTATPGVVCNGFPTTLDVVGTKPVTLPIKVVASTPYAPVSPTGPTNAGPVGDDVVSALIPIGFPFSFYGNTYTNFVISTNGFISFDAAPGAGCCSGQLLPSAITPNNVVALGWEDLTAAAGQITYYNLTAPNRMVVQFTNVAHLSAAGTPLTGQIILYDNGDIETHVTSMVHDGTVQTLGVENAAGTLAASPAGFNSALWSASNIAFKFTDSISQNSFVPSTIAWTPGTATYTPNNTVANPTAIPPAGTTIFTVTITDASGCTYSDTAIVVANPLAAGSATATPLVICEADSSQFLVSPIGGGLPYTYSWMPTTGLSNPLIGNPKASPLTTTVYTVTVMDACGGSYTQTNVVVVNPAPTVTGTATPATVCTGSMTTLTGSGNASSYSWSGGATNGVPFIPAATGVYTVTGTSINGCTATSTVLVTKIAPFYDTTGNDAAICIGGSANLIAGDSIPPVPVGCVPTYSSGTGFGDYIQSISGFLNNVTGASPSPYYTNYAAPTATLTAGTPYVLSVTTGTFSNNDVALWIDYNNNGIFDPVEKIGEFDNLGVSGVATFNVTVPLSTNNGTIKLRIVEADQGTTGGMLPCAAYSFGETEDYTITITGGVTVVPPVYTYTWMPGSLSGAAQTVTPAATTIYTVTQTDANGCTATATQVVTVNPNPTTTVTATTVASCVPGCDATATMNATGGTSPYAYTVSASATAVGNNIVGICATTTYTVTATDANGCIGTVTTTGVQATNPIVTATPAAVSVCQNQMTTLVGGGASTYSWSGSITDNTPFAVTASTIYTVTGTDAMGCSATATSDVTMLALPTVTATPAAVSVCQNATTTLVGGGASTYSWSGGITNNTPFAVTASTVYTVTGTDASGCTNTATSDVTMTAAPLITATPNTVNNCVGSSTDLTASGGLTYVWMPGSVSGSMLTVPAYTGSGTYTVTGTDAGGCSATATAVVTNTLPNGDLTQAGAGNSSSITGNQCKSTTQPNDGQPLAYFDNSCQIIASVQEPNGGLSLGPVNTCVTIDPTVQLVNGQPYARRWFEITPTTNGPATVSLYLTLADFLDYNAAPAAAGWPLLPTTASSTDPNIPNIRVTKNDAGILSVITPTVSYDVVNSRFVLTFPVSGFSQFRVHSVNTYNAPLPVTYKSFTARKENTVDVLDWTTGSEENNKQFNVERSANGEDFTKIGVVASKAPNGNSQVDINYTFVDEKPLTGHNYYRLAQEDIDGKINYSKTIDLIWGSNGTISMYPNPTSGLLNVEINVEKSSNITIRVMDMSGRTVKTTEAKAVQGVNKVELNLNDISSGIYNVQVIENGKLIVTNRVNKK